MNCEPPGFSTTLRLRFLDLLFRCHGDVAKIPEVKYRAKSPRLSAIQAVHTTTPIQTIRLPVPKLLFQIGDHKNVAVLSVPYYITQKLSCKTDIIDIIYPLEIFGVHHEFRNLQETYVNVVKTQLHQNCRVNVHLSVRSEQPTGKTGK